MLGEEIMQVAIFNLETVSDIQVWNERRKDGSTDLHCTANLHFKWLSTDAVALLWDLVHSIPVAE